MGTFRKKNYAVKPTGCGCYVTDVKRSVDSSGTPTQSRMLRHIKYVYDNSTVLDPDMFSLEAQLASGKDLQEVNSQVLGSNLTSDMLDKAISKLTNKEESTDE